MAAKISLQMEFLTDQNKKVRVTVADPKLPVDTAAVNSVMDLIVSKNIFAFPQGVIVKRIGATQIQTDNSALV